jgi:hypothetical protein
MGFFGGGGGTTPVNMVGASTGTAGTAGYVPAPAAGKNTRYLASDASFGEIPMLPQYKNTAASRYICNYSEAYSNQSSGFTTKVRAFGLIYSPADGQVDVLAYRTANAPSPAFNGHVALWECNEDGTVGSYVTGGTGSSGTSATTNINISVSATNIKRGYYYISLTTDITTGGTPVEVMSAANSSFQNRFLGGTSLNQQNSVMWYYTCLTSYDQTTHETFTLGGSSSSQNRPPALGFQYV